MISLRSVWMCSYQERVKFELIESGLDYKRKNIFQLVQVHPAITLLLIIAYYNSTLRSLFCKLLYL